VEPLYRQRPGGDREKGTTAEFDWCFGKPVSPVELFESLGRFGGRAIEQYNSI